MHLVQTPGETVYEIKLADLLCSVALEPKAFLKHFSKETSVEVKKPKSNKSKLTKELGHIFKGSYYSNEEKGSEERGKKISQGFSRTIPVLMIGF